MLKSTEIVIEQLIIGLLSIVIVNLFVWGVPLPQLNSGGNVYQSFFFGVLLVIAAYAAGIVVDRWSDTILEQLEKRVRLREYLKCITYKKFSSNSYSLPNEASLRLEIKKEDGGLADYHDYLRRRMRITRGITCLLPALFLALVFFDHQCNRQELVRWAFGGGAFCFYALVLVFSIILPKKCQVPNTHPTDKLRSKLLKFGWNGLSSSGQNSRDKNVSIQFRLRDLFHPIDPAILGLIIFVLVGMALLIYLYFSNSEINPVRIVLFFGGLPVTCLVGWTWWRISKTFFTLIRTYHKSREKKYYLPY